MDNNLNVDQNDFIFTKFVSGIKGIPLNTVVLLVNNIPDKTLNLIYSINGNDNKYTFNIPISSIEDITYLNRVRMQTTEQKPEENETKSALLSAVVFGGNPIMQLAGNSGFNTLFDSLSNNYSKVDYSAYYEMRINTTINGEKVNLSFTSDDSPEEFISHIKENK